MKRYVWIWIISCLITIQKNHAQKFSCLQVSLLPPVIDLLASQVTTIYKDSRGLMDRYRKQQLTYGLMEKNKNHFIMQIPQKE